MSPPRHNTLLSLIVVVVMLWLALRAHGAPVSDAQVRNDLEHWEAWRAEPYQLDGQWHVGLGHNLSAHAQPIRPYSHVELLRFAQDDIASARGACQSLVDYFDDLPPQVQLAVIGIAYTVGRTGFSDFRGMRLALNWRKYNLAANELANSHWVKKVSPERFHAYFNAIRHAH